MLGPNILSVLCLLLLIQLSTQLRSAPRFAPRTSVAQSQRSFPAKVPQFTTHTSPSPPSRLFLSSSDDLNAATNRSDIEIKKKKLLDTIKNILGGRGFSGKTDAFTKESVAKLGLNMLLAYGFVSNISYITCVILSWISHGKKYGVSPLAPGQWKAFLLIYSGFWVTNNILRPARFSLSLLISPIFEKFIAFIQKRTGYKKATATGIVIFLINIVGTTAYLTFGLLIATRVAKVPLLA